MDIQGEKKSIGAIAFFSRIFSSGISLSHLIISFAIIGGVAYFFGYEILANSLSGNDALNALSYITYLDKYFPRIPLWFPYQGSGVSVTLGYPQLYSYVIILLKRYSDLTYASSMAIVNFASLLIPAWGVYLFVASRLKNRTGALIAGLLFLLSPMAYIWISGAGFLAQTFSVIFVPFYLIFFDSFLDSFLVGKKAGISLSLLAIFGMLAFLSHPATGMGILAFSGLYTLGRIILGNEEDLSHRLRRGLAALVVASIAVMGLSAFWLFPLQRYLGFANRDLGVTLDTTVFAPLNFPGTLGLYSPLKYPWGDFSIYTPIWIMAFVGAIFGFFYNRKVSILGFLSLASLFFCGSTLTWQVVARLSFFIAGFLTVRPWYPLAIIINPVAAAMGAVLLARFILIPLFWLQSKAVSKFLKFFINVINSLFHSILSFVAVVFLIYLLTPLSGFKDSNKPWILPFGNSIDGINTQAIWNRHRVEKCTPSEKNPNISPLCSISYLNKYFEVNTLLAKCDSYPKDKELPLICIGQKPVTRSYKLGQEIRQETVLGYIDEKDIDNFRDFCLKDRKWPITFYPAYSPCLALGKSLLDQLSHWPGVELNRGNNDLSVFADDFGLTGEKKEILTGNAHRIDVTPHLGTAVKAWTLMNQSYMLNAYTGQLTLNKTFYSIFNDSFYDNPNTSPEVINNLAKYFGTEAVVVIASKSPIESFIKGGWERVGTEASVVFPPFKTGLVSLGDFSGILVIGNHDKGVFKQTFQIAVDGAIPLDSGIVIDGGEDVGGYSLKDLSKYSLIVLQGYRYRNRSNELAKLKDYIKSGGSVFMETGWQFVSPDWGDKQNKNNDYQISLPEPFPVEGTKWGGVGDNWLDASLDSQFSNNVQLTNFAPLIWENADWSVAYADELRDWARPIISKGGKTIMAYGQIGKGKIVWSGMNVFAHALDKKNPEEIKLLKNIFGYLLPSQNSSIQDEFSINSPQPEKVIVKLDRSVKEGESVYFRQSYFPSWQARAVSKGKIYPLKIQIAGPSFMFANLPALNRGDSIEFEFAFPREGYIGIVLSLITLVTLVIFLVDAAFLRGYLFRRVSLLVTSVANFLLKPFRGYLSGIKKDFKEEENEY